MSLPGANPNWPKIQVLVDFINPGASGLFVAHTANDTFDANVNGWSPSVLSPAPTLSWSGSTYHDPPGAMAISWPNGAVASSCWAQSSLVSGLSPGMSLQASIWLMSPSGQSGAYLNLSDPLSGFSVNSAVAPADGAWHQVTISFIVPSTGQIYLLVKNNAAITTTGWATYADTVTINNNYTSAWTDITQWCRRVGDGSLMHIETGRNYERAQTDSGSLTFNLDNSTGVFDPSNTASPFYPNVKSIRKIQVNATWGGNTYNLFYGFVEDWPRIWSSSGFRSDITATARGVLSSLSNVILTCFWERSAIRDQALAIYRMDDPSGSIYAANSSSFDQPPLVVQYMPGTTVKSKFQFGQNGGTGKLGGDPSTGLSLEPEPGGLLNQAGYFLKGADSQNTSLALPPGGPWTVEGWIQTAPNQSTSGVVFSQTHYDGSNSLSSAIAIQVSSSTITAAFQINTSTPAMTLDSSGTTGTSGSPATYVNDNAWHHFAASGYIQYGSVVLNLWVDGVFYTMSTPLVGTPDTAVDLQTLGCIYNPPYGSSPYVYAFYGYMKNFAWYDVALSPTQIQDHYLAGGGYAGYDTGSRISECVLGAPYYLTALDTGNSLLTSGSVETKNVVQAIQDANNTEAGTIIERGDGYLVFKNRQSRGGTASVVTFGEASGFPYEDNIEIDRDPREIYTTVKVSRYQGATVYDTDTAATYDFFSRTLAIDSQDNTDQQAAYLAEYMLYRYKTPHDRIPNLTINPGGNPALWPQALGRQIGDRVTVTRNNPGAPPIQEDFYIDKIIHDVGVGKWLTSYMMSSAILYDFWILQDSTFGVLDSTTRLGF